MTTSRSAIVIGFALAAFAVLHVEGAGESCDITNLRQNSGLQQCLQELSTAANSHNSQLVPPGSQLQVYMDLVFRGQDEVFPYCCDKFHAPAGVYRLNPLKEENPNNFKVRNAPSIRFFIEDGASFAEGDDNYYMIAVFDVGFPGKTTEEPWVHWMKGNIRGLDLAGSGEDWYSYINLVIEVDHVFVLYRQGREFTGDITSYGAPDSGQFCIQRRCDFDIERLISDNGMELLSASWVKPTITDYLQYSRQNKLGLNVTTVCPPLDPDNKIDENGKLVCPATRCQHQQITSDQGLADCLNAIESAVTRRAGNFFSASDDLQVYMEGTFRVQEYDVTKCCQGQHFEAAYFELKPLEHPRPPTGALVNPPEFKFFPVRSSGIGLDDGELYMMAMIDIVPDPNGVFSTADKPYLHWLVVNIPGLRVESGVTLRRYLPPGGADDGSTRTYMFVLYRQTRVMPTSASGLAAYFSPPENCFPNVPYGCQFAVNRLISDYTLQKLGTMWFFPRRDLFVVYEVSRDTGLPDSIACPIVGLPTPTECPSVFCEGGDQMNVNDCLQAIQEVGVLEIPEVLPAPEPLSLYPELTFTTQTRRITYCCMNEIITGETLVHNPLDGQRRLTFSYHAEPTLNIRGSVTPGLYTVLMMDRTFVHWAVVNMHMQDGQLSSGDQFRPLFFPAIDSVHIVLLYRQRERITRGQFEQYSDSSRCPPPPAFNGRCGFNYRKFANDLGLIMKGVNWIRPQRTELTQIVNRMENWDDTETQACPQKSTPPCPAEECKFSVIRSGNVANCLEQVHEVGNKLTPFVGPVERLLVYLDVEYHTASYMSEVCCKYTPVEYNRLNLNSLDFAQRPKGFYLAEHPEINFVIGPADRSDPRVGRGSNDYYLVLLADIQGELPSNDNWSALKPFMHWLVVNIPALDLDFGQVLLPYLPISDPRKHMFMLFRQQQGKAVFDVMQYAQQQCYFSYRADYRCNFDLYKLIREHNLELLGVSPIKPRSSLYMWYSIINNLGFPEMDICQTINPGLSYDQGKAQCPPTTTVRSTSTTRRYGENSVGRPLAGALAFWLTIITLAMN